MDETLTAAMTCDLPAPVARRLAEFCASTKTGTMQLDIKDGRIIGWKLTEAGRIDKSA